MEIEIRAPVDQVFQDPALYQLFTAGQPAPESTCRMLLRGLFKATCITAGFLGVLVSLMPKSSWEYDWKVRAPMMIGGVVLLGVGFRGFNPCAPFRMVQQMFSQPFEEPGEMISRRVVVPL